MGTSIGTDTSTCVKIGSGPYGRLTTCIGTWRRWIRSVGIGSIGTTIVQVKVQPTHA